MIMGRNTTLDKKFAIIILKLRRYIRHIELSSSSYYSFCHIIQLVYSGYGDKFLAAQ